MLLLTLSAFADPAPPAVEPPIGISIADGATGLPTDVRPLFVYPSNGILPDTLTVDVQGVTSVMEGQPGGSYNTPTVEVDGVFEADTTYILSDSTTSVTFTTGDTTASEPPAAPSLANATLVLPSGETGSGFYWSVEMAPADHTVFFSVDGELVQVVTPDMSSTVSWSRSDDTTPFCASVQARNAAGVLSDPGEPLCFGEATPAPPDDADGGCSVGPGVLSFGFLVVPLLARRR